MSQLPPAILSSLFVRTQKATEPLRKYLYSLQILSILGWVINHSEYLKHTVYYLLLALCFVNEFQEENILLCELGDQSWYK